VFSTLCYSSYCSNMLVLKFDLRWMPLLKEYKGVGNNNSMFERDAHVHAYQ
jgi:hypothetical protein